MRFWQSLVLFLVGFDQLNDAAAQNWHPHAQPTSVSRASEWPGATGQFMQHPLPFPPATMADPTQAVLPAWLQRKDTTFGVQAASYIQEAEPPELELVDPNNVERQRSSDTFFSENGRIDVGLDLYSAPDFEGGLIVYGRNVAMKFGGLVKADFIYDFDPIDATDSFDTTTIPVGAAPRTNARFHARQSRLSFDTRWYTSERVVRIFAESDFFSEGNRFRLRHAYGEVGSLLVGQTWTTFTDVAAAPATLDFEGSVSSVNRRQAQARWTQPTGLEGLTVAMAIEDPRFIIQEPEGITLESRTPSPDLTGHLRFERDWGRFHLGGLCRIVGIQPTEDTAEEFGNDLRTHPAWGLNFSGVILLTESNKAYYQVVYGDGIGSYRGLPDAAPSADTLSTLAMFGWMVGVTHEWTEQLSSNFTYAENSLDNTALQMPDDVHSTSYLAVNLICNPLDRVQVGIEYLYGTRQDVSGVAGSANRIQVACVFDLP